MEEKLTSNSHGALAWHNNFNIINIFYMKMSFYAVTFSQLQSYFVQCRLLIESDFKLFQ